MRLFRRNIVGFFRDAENGLFNFSVFPFSTLNFRGPQTSFYRFRIHWLDVFLLAIRIKKVTLDSFVARGRTKVHRNRIDDDGIYCVLDPLIRNYVVAVRFAALVGDLWCLVVVVGSGRGVAVVDESVSDDDESGHLGGVHVPGLEKNGGDEQVSVEADSATASPRRDDLRQRQVHDSLRFGRHLKRKIQLSVVIIDGQSLVVTSSLVFIARSDAVWPTRPVTLPSHGLRPKWPAIHASAPTDLVLRHAIGSSTCNVGCHWPTAFAASNRGSCRLVRARRAAVTHALVMTLTWYWLYWAWSRTLLNQLAKSNTLASDGLPVRRQSTALDERLFGPGRGCAARWCLAQQTVGVNGKYREYLGRLRKYSC